MTVKWRIAPENLLDGEEIERVARVVSLLKLENCIAIDSHSMRPDGPAISSIFLVSEDFLIEVKLDQNQLEFDLASNRSLVNYRVEFGEIKAPPAETNAVTASEPNSDEAPGESPTQFVKVTLKHTDTMASILSYFGHENVDWLDFVLTSYPKELLSWRVTAP